MISNDLLQALKDGYKQRIKWVFAVQLTLFLVVATLLIISFITKFTVSQLSFILVCVSATSFLSAIEHIILKREKWQWTFEFILSFFFLGLALFFFLH
ncbi:hypothetical protein [Priestia flexa]|uniref:hypothetical protein n=1 Tax=Priestia flexa TaxID=86664 RepID=UPI001B32517A|nr:hypothetical protein [Priestia flexa]